MDTFILTPNNPNAPEWNARCYREAMRVRAQNEDQARRVAARGTKLASGKGIADPIPVSPWLDEALVNVTPVSGRDDDDGSVGILEPAWLAEVPYRVP